MKKTTLCFVVNLATQSLLMILKKTGQGKGLWNVPGGKIQEGETPEQAAIRECIEETGIRPLELQRRGSVEFLFPNGGSWSNCSTLFYTTKYEGSLIEQSMECNVAWIKLSDIPYDKMWEDDKLWIPELLQGHSIRKCFVFNENNKLISDKNS